MDLASLRAQQIELASSVIREDRLDTDPPRYIGGADVGFEQGGEVTRAAMVVLKYPSLELVEYKVARIATTMPYIPGFLLPRISRAAGRVGATLAKTRSAVCGWARHLPSASLGRCQPLWSAGRRADHRRGEKTPVRRV